MSKLFVHNLLFRLLSPFFSGILVYILILLINNNVGQLAEEFFGEELYLCIGLSYLIQEFARLSLIFFERITLPLSKGWNFILQVGVSILLCIGLVTTVIYLYYQFRVGFKPALIELVVFNSIFAGITLIYISLYLSYTYLYQENTERLQEEISRKEGIKEDFRQFRQGINPQLLFESLESLIVLMKGDEFEAQSLLDHLSKIYRYILTGKNQELVSFEREWGILQESVALFNYLPHRKIKLEGDSRPKCLVVPGTMLFLMEQIIRSTIPSNEAELILQITASDGRLCFIYEPHEKITQGLVEKDLAPIQNSYAIYSHVPIQVTVEGSKKVLCIPQLDLHPEQKAISPI